MPWCIFSRQTDFFKEIQRYLTTMHGNQVIELSFIDNYSWKKLSLNLTGEVAELQQEEYMCQIVGIINIYKGKTAQLPKFGSLKLCLKKWGDRSLSHHL